MHTTAQKILLSFAALAFLAMAFTAPALAIGEAGAPTLLIPPNARATGMGGTGAAMAFGTDATYWNPASLGYLSYPEITFTYFKWLPNLADDLYYAYLSYAQPVEGWGTFGYNFAFFSFGEQIRTDETGNELGTFNSFEFYTSLSYGVRIRDDLSLGTNLKIVHTKLSDVGAGAEKGRGAGTTFAIDLGVSYRGLLPGLTLAAVIQNLGPDQTFIDAAQASPLPTNLKIGFAYRVLHTTYNSIFITSDMNKVTVGDNPIIGNFGAEYWYGSFVALRGGYHYDEGGNVKTPTFGAGLQWRSYRFDFSYELSSGDNAVVGDTKKFSLTLGF